ncbi:DEAD-box ATP-dependent RNA helicase 20 [Trichinella pseudospiralis]|uniref:DEAD-box ATP-dependent RNA helicase 20 n=1 Tax=Trichinella pseudospiralis TaxID=6337 RepID=A0A0V1EVH2_TRIPS|nr:DEAD-box ATP-dependent RNA helicase 20 [Trichinella pseudospiralis]
MAVAVPHCAEAQQFVPPFMCSHVDDIKFVVNYDYPQCSEDYVHRIGRTGRCNRTGTAYTFFNANNARYAKDLIDVLIEAKQYVNPKLYELVQMARGAKPKGRYGNSRWRSSNDDNRKRSQDNINNRDGGFGKRSRFDSHCTNGSTNSRGSNRPSHLWN